MLTVLKSHGNRDARSDLLELEIKRGLSKVEVG